MKNLTILLILSIPFLGCEKEIFLDDNDINPQVVVNSIFNTDSTWSILLSESRPLLSNEDLPNITNGKIRLLDPNGVLLGEFNNNLDGSYTLNSPTPSENMSYQIEVDVPNFDLVTAKSNAPKHVNVVSIDTSSNFSAYTFDFDIKIQDEKNAKNYYSVSVYTMSYWIDFETNDTIYYQSTGFTTSEPYVVNGYSDITTNERYGDEFFFSDELFDGGVIKFGAKANLSFDENGAIYVVAVKSFSEEAYKYLVSLAKYREADGDFFAEPVQVISNIENGLGVFGGVSEKTTTIIYE